MFAPHLFVLWQNCGQASLLSVSALEGNTTREQLPPYFKSVRANVLASFNWIVSVCSVPVPMALVIPISLKKSVSQPDLTTQSPTGKMELTAVGYNHYFYEKVYHSLTWCFCVDMESFITSLCTSPSSYLHESKLEAPPLNSEEKKKKKRKEKSTLGL